MFVVLIFLMITRIVVEIIVDEVKKSDNFIRNSFTTEVHNPEVRIVLPMSIESI